MPEELDDRGDQRNEDDAERDQGKVVLDDWNVAERIARSCAEANPRDGANDVVEGELRIGHRARARHERDEGADDGNEPSEHDRLAAVLFEEGVRAREMLAIER